MINTSTRCYSKAILLSPLPPTHHSPTAVFCQAVRPLPLDHPWNTEEQGETTKLKEMCGEFFSSCQISIHQTKIRYYTWSFFLFFYRTDIQKAIEGRERHISSDMVFQKYPINCEPSGFTQLSTVVTITPSHDWWPISHSVSVPIQGGWEHTTALHQPANAGTDFPVFYRHPWWL
jgi:hypothetical protein